MGLFGPKKLKEEDYYFTFDFPFESKPQEDYSEDSFTYGHSYVPFVQLMARQWFGSNPVTVREALKDCIVIKAEDAYRPLPDGEVDLVGEPTVDQSLLDSYRSFDGCERIDWNSSKIAKRWQATLEGKGVMLDLVRSPQDLSIEIIMGNWVHFDGQTPLPILGEAWRDKKSGKEFVYWFIDALCRTRKTLVEAKEHPSHLFYYPEYFQRIGCLSETLFPSSMVWLRDRLGEFGVESAKELPKVALHVQNDYYVMGVSQAEEGLNVRFDWSPETTRYGYIIDENVPFEGENEIVPQLVNSLPKVATYLMDGYCNWSFDERINFQDELFNDLLISEDMASELFKVGFIAPGAAYSAMSWRSVLSYALLDQLVNDANLMKAPDSVMFHRGGLFRLAQQGVGPAAAHAANSLYFRIIKEDNLSEVPLEAREKITSLLNYYSSYQFDRQDANALSNLAMLQSAWGDYKKALESAEKGTALFKAELSQKFVTEMSGGGPFYPNVIKWELYLTKARVLVLLEQHEKAKEPLTAMIREARSLQYDGEELGVAEKLLASL